MKTGQIVTFYSYKGGVGRTQALANIAALLALWGYRVLCVDWDLEAPGLHFYFRKWHADLSNSKGLVDLVEAYRSGEKMAWQDIVVDINIANNPTNLSIITAGRQDTNYLARMQSISWADLYSERNLGDFIEDLRASWRSEYDFVLVDSRTGVTDIGGLCTVQLPDTLAIFCTLNDQSLTGIVEFANRVIRGRQTLPYDRSTLRVLPVVTRLDLRVEYARSTRWLEKCEGAFAEFYTVWSHIDVRPATLLHHTRIPYIPYWSFGEDIAVIERGTSDPEDIGYAFESITALLAHGMQRTELLAKSRDEYVRAAVKTLKPSYRYDVAISFAGPDRQYAHSIAENLAKRNIQVFYDEFDEASLWGKNLYEYLDDVFRNQARFTLVLLSRNYAKKIWTSHERTAALAPVFARADSVLPVRLDETTIPGVGATLVYLDYRSLGAQKISDLIADRVREQQHAG